MKHPFNSIARMLTLASVLTVVGTSARGELIEFDGGFSALPYTEDGLTFTNLGTSLASVSGGSLNAGTNFDPIRVRATGAAPFNLVSLDIRQLFQNWQIVSSSGATRTPSVGTLTFTSLTGWQGISYFDLIHDPAQPNGGIAVDNIQIQYVPEPSTAALAVVGLAGLLIYRRQRRALRSTASVGPEAPGA